MKHGRFYKILLAGALVVCLGGCGGSEGPSEPAEHVHDWGEWQTIAPTCEEKGEKRRVCKTDPSHTEIEEIPALGHKWSEEWTKEETMHYRACENGCGERFGEGEHSFENGKCGVCGYTLAPSELRYEEVMGEDGQTVAGYSVIGWADGVTDRTRLVIPAEHGGMPVVAVGESAFDVDDGDGDETLASVYLPDSVKDLGAYAFYGCSGLRRVNLENVVNVYKGAFYECTGLERAEMGEIGTLGKYAFYGCASLEYVRIDGVEEFEEEALRNCPALERADFGDGVEALAAYTFYESDGVREISLGKAFSQPAEELASDIFPQGLVSVEVSAENAVYAAEGGILYDKGKTQIVYVPRGICGKVTVADGVKEIKAVKTHFIDHAYITSLTIPASVGNIENGFISKPFKGCYALAEIYDLSSAKIADPADYGFNPDTVIHTALSEASVVSDADENGFVWRTDTGALHLYLGGEKEIALPPMHGGESYTVGARAFYASKIEKLTVPSNVSALGEDCFRGSSLREAVLGEGLEEIGTGAFYGCEALAKISIPESVNKIGAGAFYGCEALERADYAGTVSRWAAIEFENGSSNIFIGETREKRATLYLGDGNPLPEKIVIEGTERIGNYAFYGAPLTEVRFGNGVKRIGQDAFCYCADLKTVVFGKDVEYFLYAFSNGSPVGKFYYEGTEESWAALNNGKGGGSALKSASVFFLTEKAGSGNGWHYGANGEIEEW